MTEGRNALAALMRKRAEIAGNIERAHRTLNDLIADLDYIDNAIRIMDPEIDASLGRKAKQVPPRMGAFKGEMSRFVLGHLRQSSEPATSLEIAYAVMEGRGLNKSDTRAVTVIRKRVSACLWKLRAKGIIREVDSKGEYKRWEMVR